MNAKVSACSNTWPQSSWNSNNLFYTKTSHFCTNNKDSKPDFGLYDEIADETSDNKESAAKNLSLKLINTETSAQVLSIFENDYLRSGRKDVYAEELCLLFHFAVKHMGNVTEDLRLSTLMDMLFNRFDNLEFDFVLTTIWSMGLLVAFRRYEIPTENKYKVIKELKDCEIPAQSIPNLPSLIFSISCMLYPHEVNEEVYDAVKRISEHYLREGIMLIEPLPASTLLMGWSRLQYHNEDYLHKVARAMKQPRFFFDCSEQDLCNIVTSISDLHFKDDELMEILHAEVMTKADDMKPYNLFVTIQSYARVVPDKQNYYFDLFPDVYEAVTQKADALDVGLYTNQWLSLACFKGKGNDARVAKMAKALVKVMDSQNKFSFSDFTASDASNILVAVSALNIRAVKFIKNLVSVAEAHMKTMSNPDLINMAKSSYYLRGFDEFAHVYQQVHSELVQRLTSLQPWERETLESIYTEQGILQDSPFIKASMSRQSEE